MPLGLNFGFMGNSLPGHPSVLDFLGVWPLRLMWVVLIVGTLWALMTVPFVVARRARDTRQADTQRVVNTAPID